MSDKPITWIATKAPAFCFLRPDLSQYIYTCEQPPIDAALYANMKRRAEVAEARIKELEGWLTELGYEWNGVNWIPTEMP